MSIGRSTSPRGRRGNVRDANENAPHLLIRPASIRGRTVLLPDCIASMIPDDILRRATWIAVKLTNKIRNYHGAQALFIFVDGRTMIVKDGGHDAYRLTRKFPTSLVGVYDARASRNSIVEDIIAMERLH